MGLREIVAGGIILLSPLGIISCAKDRTTEPRGQKAELVNIVREAEKSSVRHDPTGLPCGHNHKLEIEYWKMAADLDKQYEDRLLDSMEAYALEKMYQAQFLFSFEKAGVIRDLSKFHYKIGTADQAKPVIQQLLHESIDQLKQITQIRPDRSSAWKFLGTNYALSLDWNNALAAYRQFISLRPDDSLAYSSLMSIYQIQNKLFDVIDELDLLNVKAEVKRTKLAEAIISTMDEFKANITDTAERAGADSVGTRFGFRTVKQAAKGMRALYLTSEVRWEKEMKKELTARDYISAIIDLFWAGTLDYNISENKGEALQRFVKNYQLINGGMDNGLGRLDKYYEFLVFERKKLTITGSEDVLKALKEHYKKVQ